MKVSFIESPTGLTPDSDALASLSRAIKTEAPDLLVTNEMPFGEWRAAAPDFNPSEAVKWAAEHDGALGIYQALEIDHILSSRPIMLEDKPVNEAFLLSARQREFVHQKHFFPEEEGFYEASWFQTAKTGFDSVTAGAVRVGVLLCTEIMFNEWARAYRRQGAHLIAVPRASGLSHDAWHTALKMAALTSGCYVVSSNRVGTGKNGQEFGGCGIAYDPYGKLIGVTSAAKPVMSFDLDAALVKKRQQEYPCYVAELPTG